MHLYNFLVAASVISLSSASYNLVEDFFNGDFFDHFDFFTGADPTAGWVNYVDRSTAQAGGLINTNKGAYIGVDSTTTSVAAPGRQSVRLSSTSSYTYMLVVLSLNNMPGGVPGTWPAFWTFGPDWPNNGEIDIIEGVNGQNENFMTVHTGSSCSLNGGGDGLLQPFSTDCNANDDANAGCSFHDPDSSSYGSGFNSAGGGVFAMEWTTSGVSIWRWQQGSQPSDVSSDTPDPSGWGKPSANWATSDADCEFSSMLSKHNIIFDTTFCGQWGGAVYEGGLDACQSFVSNNPKAFADAYWGVNSLRVYQQQTSSSNSASAPGSVPPSATSIAKASPTPTPVSSSASSVVATSFSTLASPASSPSATTPTSPNANATPTTDPLTSNDFGSGSAGIPAGSGGSSSTPAGDPLTSSDFGSGSSGIPEGSEGWKRAADMRMGERRRRKHLARHIQAAKL